MPYSAEISRAHPTAILLLLDQSASMQDAFGGADTRGDDQPSKARVLADAVNRMLHDLVLRCAKEDGVRDYFHVGVIGYGERVHPLIRLDEARQELPELIPVSLIADNPLRLEERIRRVPDGAGGLVEQRIKFPVWFDPNAKNGTPMCQAIDAATTILRKWIDRHPTSFPPIVLNVTDGEATDGDPLHYAQVLRSYATADGEVLLFNVHLSSVEERPIELPDSSEGLPDEHALLLFRMSSELPFTMRNAARGEGYAVNLDTRGFVFNADPVALIRFLEIGTRPSNLR